MLSTQRTRLYIILLKQRAPVALTLALSRFIESSEIISYLCVSQSVHSEIVRFVALCVQSHAHSRVGVRVRAFLPL